MDNLRKPIARISESEAVERAEALRQRDHHFNCTSARGILTGKVEGGEFKEFRRNWFEAQESEDEGFNLV